MDRRIIRQKGQRHGGESGIEGDESPGLDKTGSLTDQQPTRAHIALRTPGKTYPTPVQHLLRSFIHMTQYFVSTILMLQLMYFNGYVIVSIILGAGLGYAVFWVGYFGGWVSTWQA